MLKRIEDLPSDPLSEAVFGPWTPALMTVRTMTAPRNASLNGSKGILPLTACLFAETLARLRPQRAVEGMDRRLPDTPCPAYRFSGPPRKWERVFEALVHKLQQPVVKEKAKKRIAWLVDTERFPRGSLGTVFQRRGLDRRARHFPSNGCTRNPETLDWLTEQDRSVLATLRWSRSWNGTTCEADPYRALPALAGHPNLLRASDRVPISLACKPVELVVRQERNGYSLALSRWMPRGEMQCVEAAPRSYILYYLPGRLEGTADLLGEHGLSVPTEGGPRVLELIRNLDEDVVRPVIRAEEVSASVRLLVRLRPSVQALKPHCTCVRSGCPAPRHSLWATARWPRWRRSKAAPCARNGFRRGNPRGEGPCACLPDLARTWRHRPVVH